MINILSYVGMNLQSEVCLWCLLGLVRTIFDATLFKVNANLKQVWQMNMPGELSMPVQRALRTMVSGVMLVQCFTVYIYLAAYIVLLYPVFLEERPTLVLPWLLLAAVRKLLCELMSLALGLGTCLLLGPARPPCIKFVIVKFTSIIPIFYMWMLVFSYYHALKVAAAFKTFPAGLPPSEHNYGLELAVRRRRTKSLLGEEQLRKKLVASFYREGTPSTTNETFLRPALQTSSGIVNSTDTSIEEEGAEADVMKPLTTGWSDIGAYEDWFGSEVMIPRDTDRILEQIVLMLLRVGAYLKKEGKESIVDSQILNSALPASWHRRDNIDCAAINADDTDTPPHIGSSKGNIASYLREYPQIFMKKQTSGLSQTELTLASLKAVHSHVETNEGTTSKNRVKRNTPSATSCEAIASVEFGNVPSKRKITLPDTTSEDKTVKKLTLPSKSQTKRMATTEENKIKLKLKQRTSERQSEKIVSEIINKLIVDLLKTKTSASDYNKASSHSKDTNTNSNKDSMETLTNDNNERVSHLTMSDENIRNYEKNKIPQLKENNNDEFMFGIISIVGESLIESKLLNSDKGASDITILNETNNEETGSRLFNDENKEMYYKYKKSDSNDYTTCTRCIMSNKASGQTILKENNNWESMFSQTLNVDHEDVSNDGKILSAGTNSEISISSKNEACRCGKISKVNNSILNNNVKESSNNNLNLNENKDVLQKNTNKKELPEHQINDTNKELPLRILSSEDKFVGSLDTKESNIDSKRKKTYNKTKNKYNEIENKEILNKELLLRTLSNDDNTDTLDIKVSKKDSIDKNSTDGKILNVCDCTKCTEANSNSSSIESVAKNSKKSNGKNRNKTYRGQ